MGLVGFLENSVINVWKWIECFWKCTWWDLTLIYYAPMGLFNAAVFVFIHRVNWWLLSPDSQLVCQAINTVHSPPNTSWVCQGFLTLHLLLFEKKSDVFVKPASICFKWKDHIENWKLSYKNWFAVPSICKLRMFKNTCWWSKNVLFKRGPIAVGYYSRALLENTSNSNFGVPV